MLSKCANPVCLVPFRYLREGRIFNVEMRKGNGQEQTRIEHFWLCESCAKVLKVVFDNGVVTTRPLRLSLPPAVPQKTERERNVA